MGAAFNGPCDANIFQNSYDGTYTDILCRTLNSTCHTQAWSGIGISCYYGDPNGQPCDPAAEYTQNMPNTFLYSIAALRETGDASALWDFSQYVPDLVLMNLGTNDWSRGRADNATFQAIYVQTYLQFLANITQVYYKRPSLPLFLAMGPLSMEPLAAVQQVVSAWNARGGNATLLALPAPGLPIGCAGHPSPSMHAYMATTATPVIKQVMGW